MLIGGGISRQSVYLTDRLQNKVAQRVFGVERSYLSAIRCAELENEAGMIGAAHIADRVPSTYGQFQPPFSKAACTCQLYLIRCGMSIHIPYT